MDENDIIERFGLVPRAEGLPENRALVHSLTMKENRDGNALCVLLFAAGDPRDSLLIFKAKMSSFDAACYIDVQLVCGAGIEYTKDFLLNSQDHDARKLLEDLAACISAGDFAGFTPASHLESYREYYGLDP